MKGIFKNCNLLFGSILIIFGVMGLIVNTFGNKQVENNGFWFMCIMLGIIGIQYRKDTDQLKDCIKSLKVELKQQSERRVIEHETVTKD